MGVTLSSTTILCSGNQKSASLAIFSLCLPNPNFITGICFIALFETYVSDS
ncbi:hypothetical protein SLEP1_g58510 [Rubroshorea leprosula]|uniref:Uncharacterized protein n=1 Tax=Rubroshorea leprosula TaxID=152421 RepID=A0AAV5MTL5_9ROSI|nr:hypothetical protein SLEP1_g58510 [Rubroshorea leprosula]